MATSIKGSRYANVFPDPVMESMTTACRQKSQRASSVRGSLRWIAEIAASWIGVGVVQPTEHIRFTNVGLRPNRLNGCSIAGRAHRARSNGVSPTPDAQLYLSASVTQQQRIRRRRLHWTVY